MNVLITGASGLIGGRLIRHLLHSGDVRIRAASRTLRTWPAGVEGHVVNLTEAGKLREACAGVSAVINLAGLPELACALDPHAALRANAGGTLAWASAAQDAGVRRFVQVSTYKVYGVNLGGAVTETSPTNPRSHYAITHRAAEDYARSQHADSVIFRLANGFGAPATRDVDCWGIIVNEFCRQAVAEHRITIRSSGRAWRNFIPVEIIAKGLHRAAQDLPAGTYNFGATESMTLVEAASRVAEVCRRVIGISPEVVTTPGDPGERDDPLDFRVDRLIGAGFTPDALFEAEVERTLQAARAAFGHDVTR